MSTVELRKEVINSLANVDERFLRMVRSLLNSYKEEDVKSFDELPEIVQKILVKSNEEARQGKVTPHKEIMEKYRRKFNVAG